jgi:hypothetical protein
MLDSASGRRLRRVGLLDGPVGVGGRRRWTTSTAVVNICIILPKTRKLSRQPIKVSPEVAVSQPAKRVQRAA